MKKTLLLFSLLILSISSYSQVTQSYGTLKEEDIDMTITDENYLLYKISTTKPKTVPKEIDQKYVIKDFDWNKIFSNKSKTMYNFAVKLNDYLKVREPLEGESPNYIYYQADISTDSLPFIIQTKYRKTIGRFRDGNYSVQEIKSLHDLDFVIKCDITDANNGRIILGKNCDITTELISERNVTRFIIAIELMNRSFSDINKGTIELNFCGFHEPQKKTIRESDVGKSTNFGVHKLDVIAFENGVLHIKHRGSVRDYKYFANIKGEKFRVKCHCNVIPYVAYNKYRNKPNLSHDKFLDYLKPKSGDNINPQDFNYNVSVLNFGYDVDSVNIYEERYPVSAIIKQVVSIRKNDGVYDINPIVTKKTPLITANDHLIIRKYFSDNAKYPEEAMDLNIEGDVKFKFKITPEGKMFDIEIISSPHESFTQEVLRIARTSKVKLNIDITMEGGSSIRFSLK